MSHIPQPHGRVEATRGEEPAIGTESDGVDTADIADERGAEGVTAPHVPQAHGSIVADRGEDRAIRAERHTSYIAGVAGQRRAEWLKRDATRSRNGPELDRRVPGARGDQPAIGADGHGRQAILR